MYFKCNSTCVYLFDILCFLFVDDPNFSTRYNHNASRGTAAAIATRSRLSYTTNNIICLNTCTMSDIIITFPSFCLSSSISCMSIWSAWFWSFDWTANLLRNISYNHRMIISAITHSNAISITSMSSHSIWNGCSHIVSNICIAFQNLDPISTIR